MRYAESYEQQLNVVGKAVRFANRVRAKGERKQEWATEVCKELGVVTGGRYTIDQAGQLVRQSRSGTATPDSVEKGQGQLRRLLDAITLDSEAIPDDARRRRKRVSKDTVDPSKALHLDFSGHFWIRVYAHGAAIANTTQKIVTPTLDSFVQYAAILLARRSWRTRVSKRGGFGP